MSKKQIIVIVVIGVGVFAAGVLLKSVFIGKPKNDIELLREVIAAKNESIQILKQNATADSLHYENDIRKEREYFDELAESFKQRQATYKPLIQKYENIPIAIRNLSKDSLRIAAHEAASD